MRRRSSIMLAAGALLAASLSGHPGAGNVLALSRPAPHAVSGPVAASAWAGWIPAGQVLDPSSAAVTAHTVYYRVSGSSEVVARESASTSKLPGWPSVFLRSVGGLQAGREPSIAGISSLARTAAGFVLSVRLTDPNYGTSAGMIEADYYWSDRLIRIRSGAVPFSMRSVPPR